MAPSALGPLVVLAAALVTDVWVYRDASARADRGRPVIGELGALRVDSPQTWFVGCLLLWVVFLPWYLAARAAGER